MKGYATIDDEALAAVRSRLHSALAQLEPVRDFQERPLGAVPALEDGRAMKCPRCGGTDHMGCADITISDGPEVTP